MRKIISLGLLCCCLFNGQAQVSSTTALNQAKDFQKLDSRQLEIVISYMTSLMAVGAISSSAALAQAASWQGLDDKSLQVIQAYYLAQIATGSFPTGALGTISVSPKGITNGLSAIANDGARFGPDTPGTQTSGIQEALNAIPRGGPGWGTNTTGALLQFAAGDFYFTNNIFYSNTFPYSIRWEGSALLASRLIYAGNSTTNLIMFTGGGNPNGGLSLPGQVEIEHLTFSSISNGQVILLVITNCSAEIVRNCNFTGWQITTNNLHGTQVSIDGPAPDNAQGNVGLAIGTGLDHATIIEDCFFAGLATGAFVCGDHFSGLNLKSAFIGEFGGGPSAGTAWANTSPFSLGAFILRNGGLETRIVGMHAYICQGGVALLNGSAGLHSIIFPQWELCDRPLSSTSPSTVGFAMIETQTGDTFGTATGQNLINTSPYSYSTTTIMDCREIIWNKLLPSIGLDLNNNPATNAGRFSAQTNICVQPAAGFTPNFNQQNDTAVTNNGGTIVFAPGTLPTRFAGDMIYHETLIHKTAAGDQAILLPAPYVTNNANAGGFGSTYRCTNNTLLQFRIWPGILTNVFSYPIN